MQARQCVRVICALAISIPVLGVRDLGALASADVNGDRQVNVLDLQTIIAKTLQPDNAGNAHRSGPVGPSSVLDFQRALREVQLGRHERQIPASKPGGPDTCVFSYQTGRMADLFNHEIEAASAVVLPPVLSEPGVHVERCIVPTTTERYLFILTPNAPPFTA